MVSLTVLDCYTEVYSYTFDVHFGIAAIVSIDMCLRFRRYACLIYTHSSHQHSILTCEAAVQPSVA
jgi:hypothetical protein